LKNPAYACTECMHTKYLYILRGFVGTLVYDVLTPRVEDEHFPPLK